MSEQKKPEEIRPEDMSLDELIRSTKEDIREDRPCRRNTRIWSATRIRTRRSMTGKQIGPEFLR